MFHILAFPGTWLGIAELWGISHRQEIPLVVFSTNTITGVTFSQVPNFLSLLIFLSDLFKHRLSGKNGVNIILLCFFTFLMPLAT